MKTISRLFVSSLFAGAVALASSTAHAESNRGAGYIQGEVLGYSLMGAPGVDTPFGSISASYGAYPIEIHGGYHLGGTHEGFVLGGSQKFFFGSASSGATLLRAGYDIAIPIKGGEMELTVAPFGFGGIYYGFSGGDPRAMFGFGAEARFFPLNEGAGKGFFAAAKPIELGFLPGTGGLFTTYTFHLGAGYAF
jgi:hypothetical protein